METLDLRLVAAAEDCCDDVVGDAACDAAEMSDSGGGEGAQTEWRGLESFQYAIGPSAQQTLPPDLITGFSGLLMRAFGFAGHGIARLTSFWLDDLQRLRERRKQRHIFAKLDDHVLKDIGLSRCDLYDDLAHRQRYHGRWH